MMKQTACKYRQNYTQARGVSLVAVLFILIVLGGLAAVMAQMGATQHVGYLLSQEGKQAYYAARSGLEWGRHQVITQNDCFNDAQTEEAGFQIHLSCQASLVFEGNESLNIYHLNASAAKSTPFGEIQREAEATIWSPVP
ncbi:hypothetical protein [Nitrincola sp. A-D6]|uniref:hypothetical protein n=1 Tax=Nitrincola sp. A-D6 TaxID=1545442 RepID=UPI00068C52DC|nr:hypothetical protein [Nitrincola sp. A-D6]